MEATSAPTATDRELALRLGALMLHVLGSDGGAVLRAMDDTGLTFVQMKALFTIAAADPDGEPTSVKSLAERLGRLRSLREPRRRRSGEEGARHSRGGP